MTVPLAAFTDLSALVEIDPARTAVLVIDMQNRSGSPGGMFDKAGVPIASIQAALDEHTPGDGDTVLYKTRFSAFYRPSSTRSSNAQRSNI